MTQHQRQDRHLHAEDEPGHLTEVMWSVEKTAEFLDVPKGTLYQWISHGRGPRSYKVGGSRKFDPVDVRVWLREHMTEPVNRRRSLAAPSRLSLPRASPVPLTPEETPVPRPRRNRRPPGQVHVICTGRSVHNPVPFRPDLRLLRRDGQVRVQWDRRQGTGPITDFRAADGLETFEVRCGTCASTSSAMRTSSASSSRPWRSSRASAATTTHPSCWTFP